MYKLYYSPSTASLAVHWMLIELGVSFELVLTDIEKGAQKSAEYLKLNPAGRVPTLVVDGAPHTEVAALLMLLAERHPEAGFAPAIGAPERADYLQWMFFCANTLQPAYRHWFYADEAAGPENAEAAKTRARANVEGGLARLDALLADGRKYLLGPKLSALDFLATMLTRWSRNMPKPATAWPHLGAYINRMRAMPSLREVHKREGLTDWINAS
ncbi:MAG: glutathione S-transferase family protein [Rhizomicrobium sp.]